MKYLGLALAAWLAAMPLAAQEMRDCGTAGEPLVEKARAILNVDFTDFALRVAGQIEAAETYCRMDFSGLGVRLFAAANRLARLCAEADAAWVCVPAVAGAQFSGQIAVYRDSVEGNLPSGIANGCIRLAVALDRDRPEIADNFDALERSVLAQQRLADRLQANRAERIAYCSGKARGISVDPQLGTAPPPRPSAPGMRDE